MRDRWSRSVAVVAVLAATLFVWSDAASSAAYPTNLPPGYSSIPWSMQTFTWSHPGTFSNGTPGIRCYVGIDLVIDGFTYADQWRPDREDIRGPVWLQHPIGNAPPKMDDKASTTVAFDVETSENFSEPYKTWFATDSWDPAGHGVPVWGRAGMAQVEDGCSKIEAQAAKEMELRDMYALWTDKFVPHHDPVADFDYVVTDPATNVVAFTNRSNDAEDGTDLSSQWSFGDGGTSGQTNPTHAFAEAGTHSVTLTVTDSQGDQATVTKDVELTAGLVVNSTGDAAAEDPGDGCDTGATTDSGDAECTLRAAIEAADADGGGEITFAIPGSGAPEIALTSPLPPINTNTTVDGTTQEGGRVGVVGSGTGAFTIEGGTVRLSGLAVRGPGTAVSVAGGSDHAIDDVWFGTDAAGAVADEQTNLGVLVGGASGTTITDAVFASDGVVTSADATGTEVRGSTFGLRADGSTPLGEPELGVVVLGPDAQITGNATRTSSVGVAVAGPAATGATVSDNRLGTSADGGTAFDGTGYAVRVDGAPGATVSGNRAAATTVPAAIAASGRVQLTQAGEGRVDFVSPLDAPGTGAVTGGSATIEGNVVGLTGRGTAIDGHAVLGIVAWSGLAGADVRDNVVASTDVDAYSVYNSSEVTLTGNRAGLTASDAPVAMDGVGVHVVDSTGVTIGTAEAPNRLSVEDAGIQVEGGGAAVVGNVVTGHGSAGIDVEGDGATIRQNTVTDGAPGIAVEGDTATITGNVVTGGNDGIAVDGDDATVGTNRVGVRVGSDTVVPAAGSGISVRSGHALVQRNIVAGWAAHGVDITTGATADLRANRIWSSGGTPINAPGGGGPRVEAVRTGAGDDERTSLVVHELPDGDAGRIEVFADDGCGGEGGEARRVLEVTRVKKPGETVRIIHLKETREDAFTVTYTTADGSTGPLSACAEATRYADSDGDGSIDPFDDIFGSKDDPAIGIVVTDAEQLLMATVLGPIDDLGNSPGRLEQFGPVDDPAPGAHPAGWSLPYGALRFRVTGLPAGGTAVVALSAVSDVEPIQGDAYWKFGSATPGASPTWYPFTADDESGTGSKLTTLDLPVVGLRRVMLVVLRDGARGDEDGGANGSITDPGGPVLGGQVDPPTVTTTTSPPTTSTTTVSSSSTSLLPTTTGSTSPATTGSPSDGTSSTSDLARTGSNPGPAAGIGALLLAIGVLLVAAGRRSRATTSR